MEQRKQWIQRLNMKAMPYTEAFKNFKIINYVRN